MKNGLVSGGKAKDDRVVGMIDFRHLLSDILSKFGEISDTVSARQNDGRDMLQKCSD